MRTKRFYIIVILGFAFIALLLKLLFFHQREIVFNDAILYGNVKSVKEFSYKAKQTNKGIIKLKRWRYAHLTDDFECYFDIEGKLRKKIIYPADKYGKTHHTRIYLYDSAARLTKEYSPELPHILTKFQYNKSNQLMKEIRLDRFTNYVYFADGKLKKTSSYDHDLKNGFINTFHYKNDFIKYIDIHCLGPNWHLIEEFERDNCGNITKYRLGQSFEEIKNDKWDNFEYTFDCIGNWTKCIHFRNKKPLYILEREIIYF